MASMEHRIQLDLDCNNVMMSNKLSIILKHAVQCVHMDPTKCLLYVLSITYVQFPQIPHNYTYAR